jgi:hypothetical protein
VPRFFFHTNNPLEPALQDEGLELETVHAARCKAVRYAGQLLCDVGERFWDTADFELSVTDDRGLILFTMRVVGTEAPAIRDERGYKV